MSFTALSVISALVAVAPDAPVRASATEPLAAATPAAEQQPSPVTRRTARPAPRIAEPVVAVPLIVGGGAAALSVYFFSVSQRDFDRSRNAPLPSLDSARPLLESGARNQWWGTGTAALSALALGTAGYFLFRPEPNASAVALVPGPGSLTIAGSWR